MKEFKWRTPEYAHYERSSDWFWTVGIITGALVIVSILFGNALFGLVLAIGAFTLCMFASRRPNVISVEVVTKGVVIERTLYPFASLDAFYVDTEHYHGPRLFLKSKKVLMPLIVVPVADVDTDELRIFLTAHLKEEVFEQGAMQTLFERLGF